MRSHCCLQILASCITRGGEAQFLIGSPESRKTTLTLEMLLSGLKCLTDEVALVNGLP
jgi:hypothetical protein